MCRAKSQRSTAAQLLHKSRPKNRLSTGCILPFSLSLSQCPTFYPFDSLSLSLSIRFRLVSEARMQRERENKTRSVAQAQQLPNVQMDDGWYASSIHPSIHPSFLLSFPAVTINHGHPFLFISKDNETANMLRCFQVNFAPFDRLPPNLIVENDSTFHQFL